MVTGIMFVFMGKAQKNSNIHRGFTAAIWLPDTITPEMVIAALSHCAGAVRRTGTVSSFKAGVFLFCAMIKGILPSQKKNDIYDTSCSLTLFSFWTYGKKGLLLPR